VGRERRKDREWNFGQRVTLAVVPSLVAFILRIIGSTLKYDVICEPGVTIPAPPGTGIYCLWHRAVILATIYFRGYPAVVMISQSFDGELITRAAAKLGFGAARGSSSRGSLEALLGMKKALEEERPAIFTADGPRGPIYQTKMGPIKLAQMTGFPAGAFYLLPERTWEVKSWDRLLIPKPFSRVVLSFAQSIPVDRDATDLEPLRLQLQDALERARRTAEAHLAATRKKRK
jgi:lysophospholipid acyltransferase (LPLAT)-like uncharacterized protein